MDDRGHEKPGANRDADFAWQRRTKAKTAVVSALRPAIMSACGRADLRGSDAGTSPDARPETHEAMSSRSRATMRFAESPTP